MYTKHANTRGVSGHAPLITQSRLSVAQASCSLNGLIRVHPHQLCPPLKLKCSVLLVNYSCLNDCYSEVMAYTALANPYWASFHDTYRYLSHAH